MSVSAFEHPFLSGLVGDDETGQLFSVNAEIDAMLAFETGLAKAEASCGIVPAEAAERIAAALQTFEPDMAGLRNGAARDGVVVPELVKQLRDAVSQQAGGGEAARHVHFGATSQDVIDTALIIRLKQACSLFIERLAALEKSFDDIDRAFGTRTLMGHTRMQAAIPITVSDRIRAWKEPLTRHRHRLDTFSETGFAVQFGGAAGSLEKFGDKAADVRKALAWELFLTDAPQWQSQRDRLAEFANILTMISGSLGKLGQDVALLALMAGEMELAGGGGSSAMAHKQNPVAAEVLVSLARFNAVQLSGMQQSMVHEQERSGAAWTLEWLILPSMVIATGASLRLAAELAGNVRSLGTG
ncbi:3-carboxy-cis,cis-muconate cycloisomerase [Neorhizobium galegae]|uniref:3-carboxy-cis,cis-muconate cycloisomerase n=1 Tax=Neorhizobium galegae TaxID=399 RepID=UPI0006213501|nr:3-carboxy-cis,cis-muconate cycloisomerase [Neorhizobium galegae]MCQ1768277.1 3-carboxy-cis,cis-muconate cycloisomerase [Neorhizobium galegae]MCQ1847249.1 3-carboxy-cis,cis-muconate cycloisomerase [Neorhizobium galegae]CDZ34460.1 3-carboxy-cis,cis-muconate cycloisomerase [Neorhizobium galegae bv. officinalis]